MLQQLSTLQPFNNDRSAYMAAFRHPAQPVVAAATPALTAAPAAPLAPQTHDAEAEGALASVRQEMDAQGAPALAQVHGGLDAERVARLLGLLD